MIEIMDRVGVRVGDLAASSEVQAANVNEVNTAVADLERNTQQNAAMAEELSAASELLKTAVTALTEQTAIFVRSESNESIQSNVRYLN
jgi:methyl-accepting chemotaxis protein